MNIINTFYYRSLYRKHRKSCPGRLTGELLSCSLRKILSVSEWAPDPGSHYLSMFNTSTTFIFSFTKYLNKAGATVTKETLEWVIQIGSLIFSLAVQMNRSLL